MTSIAKWDIFEARLAGPAEGNPYLEVSLSAVFTQAGRQVRVPGFYDGDGQYVIRFMPDAEGEWSYETTASVPALSGQRGSFTATARVPAPMDRSRSPTSSTSPMPTARPTCPSAPPATPGRTSRWPSRPRRCRRSKRRASTRSAWASSPRTTLQHQ